MPFIIVSDPWAVVLSYQFHQNRSCGFPPVGVKNCLIPLHLPLAYTTAYTTTQAVIDNLDRLPPKKINTSLCDLFQSGTEN